MNSFFLKVFISQVCLLKYLRRKGKPVAKDACFPIKGTRFLGEIGRKCANVHNFPFRAWARNMGLGMNLVYHILPESKEAFKDKWGHDNKIQLLIWSDYCC